jgi:hypothetical protein
MKITARGGTDGANIVLFWPDNLPDDADDCLERDPIAMFERLRNDGKLIWFLCDSDGEYSVAIFLHCAVPDGLVPYCKDEEHIPVLTVRGVAYFGGMEYMFKLDRRLLGKHLSMCEEVVIPDGTYSARVYRTDVPESVYDSWLVSHAGASAKRLWDMHGTIAACAVVSVVATLIAFFGVSWSVWFWFAAIASTLVASAALMSRTHWYKSVDKAQAEYAKAYPAYVVHLE